LIKAVKHLEAVRGLMVDLMSLQPGGSPFGARKAKSFFNTPGSVFDEDLETVSDIIALLEAYGLDTESIELPPKKLLNEKSEDSAQYEKKVKSFFNTPGSVFDQDNETIMDFITLLEEYGLDPNSIEEPSEKALKDNNKSKPIENWVVKLDKKFWWSYKPSLNDQSDESNESDESEESDESNESDKSDESEEDKTGQKTNNKLCCIGKSDVKQEGIKMDRSLWDSLYSVAATVLGLQSTPDSDLQQSVTQSVLSSPNEAISAIYDIVAALRTLGLIDLLGSSDN